MLPPHIQIIGLSATLDKPERFARWIETKGGNEVVKPIYLTRKLDRPVPLTHYAFLTVNNSIFKVVKDKTIQAEINKVIGTPFVIQDPVSGFNELNFLRIQKMRKLFDTNIIRVKRAHVLDQVSKYLVENEMLPALCYVFSRKQLEICAKELTTPLFEFDSKVPYTIHHDCEQILRKLPNYKEYLNLPEYCELVELLRKGIAIHHAGMMPVLREIVEILFAKGSIKMLFCTTSVAIGLNLPVKTCIFTDIYKHDGDHTHILQGHEYVQAAGRAGRLGIDTVGNVIHLSNLFTQTEMSEYKNMLKGVPQTLVSKFKISFNLIINLIEIGNTDFIEFTNKSMRTEDIENQKTELCRQAELISRDITQIASSILNIEEATIYMNLMEERPRTVNKKRKDIDRRIQMLVDANKFIGREVDGISKLNDKKKDLVLLNSQFNSVSLFMRNNVSTIVGLLEEHAYVLNNALTVKGMFASNIKEVHCLVFATIMEDGRLDGLCPSQIVSILSCFTNVKVNMDLKMGSPVCCDKEVSKIVEYIRDEYAGWMDKESDMGIQTGMDYDIHYDLLDWMEKWCECDCENSCKYLLQELSKEKGIFLGEFIKALLKINNICGELENVATLMGNIRFLSVLKQIPELTLKYVATSQSLYI
jgi:superfamily II RNA helicase